MPPLTLQDELINIESKQFSFPKVR